MSTLKAACGFSPCLHSVNIKLQRPQTSAVVMLWASIYGQGGFKNLVVGLFIGVIHLKGYDLVFGRIKTIRQMNHYDTQPRNVFWRMFL